MHLMDLTRHNRPILHSRIVSQSKYTPHHHICIFDVVAAGDRISDAIDFLAGLHGEAAAGVELVVAVLCDPEVVLGELCALGLDGGWVGEKKLSGWGNEFVAYAVAADWVFDALVDDLENPVEAGLSICPGGLLEGCFAYFVVVASWVGFGVHGHCMRFFGDNGVVVSINGGINAEGKDVLMILSQHARVNHVSVVGGLASVNVDTADDSSGAGFDVDATALVELVGKHVFVVGQCDDELNHQHSAACYHCTASAPVRVLPTNTLVLFVQTDNIWVNFAFSIVVDDNSIKVLDDTQAIASQGQVVCAVACSASWTVSSL